MALGALQIKGISKKYSPDADVFAVSELSISCQPGDFLALLGPSGCGKSTTLRMIAGLEKPSSGDILIDGKSIVNLPARERFIGLAFETYSLYPPLSVFDNIAFNLRARRVNEQEIKRRVHDVAERMQITELLREKPSRLSGGQKQRVNIARAIVREPKVLLLDEPLSHLDAQQRKQMRGEIQRLQHDLRITTILVTHDQQEAMALATHVAVLDNGILQQFSSVQELYDLPANLFSASFIGEPPMNLLPVQLEIRSGRVHAALSETIVLKMDAILPDRAIQEAVCGIRPQDIRIVERGLPNSFSGEVVASEFLGEEQQMIVSLAGVTITVWTMATRRFVSGDQVGLRLDRWHIFDSASEERLVTHIA